jgi:hypothetical protein
MTALERRTRLLMWAYPSGYRAERGGEIIDTLIDAAPADRKWPTFRDSGALIIGGLRVRTAQNRRLGTMANWRLALLFALVLYIGPPAAMSVGGLVYGWFGSSPVLYFHWYEMVSPPLTLVAVVLAWFAASRVAVAAAVLAAAAAIYAPHRWLDGAIQAVLLILMAMCARGRDRMPRSWLLLVAAPAYIYLHFLWQGLNLPGTWPSLVHAVGVAVLIWMIFDARPIIAVAVYLILTGVVAQIEFSDYGNVWYIPSSVLYPLSAVVVALATWRVRRQAVL